MDKLINLVNELAEKYKFEQADLDRVDQAIMEIAGVDMGEGDEFNNPYGEEEDAGEGDED
jgi:hypothetical protein